LPGTNNPRGRPVGSRNKRDAELLDRLGKRGDRLAVDILSEIGNDKNETTALRIQALAVVAPYQTAKFGLVPAPPPLVYIEAPELPHPHVSELTHIVENIEFLSAARREGRIDQAACDALVSDQRIAGAHLIEHQKALAAQGGPRDQRIEIIGGLPPLPGTNIDMSPEPRAAINGQMVRLGPGEAPGASIEPPPDLKPGS
jgi:hypothetical protein